MTFLHTSAGVYVFTFGKPKSAFICGESSLCDPSMSHGEQSNQRKERSNLSEKQSSKERIKEITAGIEKGIMELFESDRYRNYLTTMSIYNPGTRLGLIHALVEMRTYLDKDEQELKDLTDSAIAKLNTITDAEFDALDLVPDFDP